MSTKTYGTVIRRGSWLHIKAMPQVAMLMRRVFAGAKRGKDNTVIITGNDFNCHQLEWFMIQYPLIYDTDAVAPMAAKQRERMAKVEETRNVDYTPPQFDLALPARDYQRVAADLAIRSGGLLLADDVGLGKTVNAIATFLAQGALPAIVVTLTHLTGQWQREIKRFAPNLRTHVLSKGTAYALADKYTEDVKTTGTKRIVRSGVRALPDVIIMNYHKLDGWADALCDIKPGMLVFDEVQELRKGDKSKKGEAAIAVRNAARYCLGLSATPIYNYGGEIWNIMNVISPGLLGEESEFRVEWCEGTGDKAVLIEPEAMRSFLVESGAMLRRRRRDVGRELPQMQRIWQTVETNRDGFKDIHARVAELARAVLSTNTDPFAKMKTAGELDWRLRQATGLAKARGVIDFVRMLIEAGEDPKTESVLLYGYHHIVFSAWAEGFKEAGIKTALFTGEETAKEKQAAIDGFVDGDVQVLMMQIRAGAGIDGLQHVSNTVVVGELDWSPGVHIQAEGRLDRDGQTLPVTAFYLVSEDGSDPVMQDVLGLKESQRHGIVDGDLGAGSEVAQVDPQKMKRLAEAWLAKHGG